MFDGKVGSDFDEFRLGCVDCLVTDLQQKLHDLIRSVRCDAF